MRVGFLILHARAAFEAARCLLSTRGDDFPPGTPLADCPPIRTTVADRTPHPHEN